MRNLSSTAMKKYLALSLSLVMILTIIGYGPFYRALAQSDGGDATTTVNDASSTPPDDSSSTPPSEFTTTFFSSVSTSTDNTNNLPCADFDNDNVVTEKDVAFVQAHSGTTGGFSDGDVTGNGLINSSDIVATQAQLGRICKVTVTLIKYIDGAPANAQNANNTSFSMTSTWNDPNGIGSGSGSFTLDPSGTPPYQAVTSKMNSGADYSAVENLSSSCDGNAFSLQGYKLGDSEADALSSSTVQTASFNNLTQNEYILVMNHDCSVPPPQAPCTPNDALTVVSDTTTMVDGHNAVAVTPHPAWTTIPGATWIYTQALDQNGSSPTDVPETFTKTFNISGDPSDSTLEIAADNYYTVKVNGQDLPTGDSSTTLDNFSSGSGAPHSWTIPAALLQSGNNTISFTIVNPSHDSNGNAFGDPNPAGLDFKITVNSENCVKVHIFKFVGNADASTQVPDNSTDAPFPMHSSWQAANLNGGAPSEGDYELGDNYGGAALKYAADTSPMQTPVGSYSTFEKTTDTDESSPVLPSSADCSADKFRLVGYKSGDSLAAAENAEISNTPPTFTNFSQDEYVIVVNEDCNNVPATGTAHIIVQKITNLEGDNTEFNFTTTGTDYTKNFILTNNGQSNDEEVTPGTYTITEGADFPGWTLTGNSCVYDNKDTGFTSQPHSHQVTLDAGDTVTCTFTNTYSSKSEGHLIVKKVLVNAPQNASPSDFSFVLNDATSSHAFDQSGENDVTLTPGTYTITEPAVDGYTTSYDNCDNLEIGNGDTVTCTITNTVPTSSGNGGGSNEGSGIAPLTAIAGSLGPGASQGQVLGTSTGPTMDTGTSSCSVYLTEYMRYGHKNDPAEVIKLQSFLNEFQNAGLPLTGFFGRLTLAAVKIFQIAQEAFIRTPWANANVPITNNEWPTGYVYKTTLWRINQLKCQMLNQPVPQLP